MRFLLTAFFLSGVACTSHAGVIKEIQVLGNHRVSTSTIILHSGLSIGEAGAPEKLDAGLKKLFQTYLFSDVKLYQKKDVVYIDVKENPVINQVVFEGNKKIADDLLNAELLLRPRDVFTQQRVRSDVERILTIYRRQGRFAAIVEPKIIKLGQNRVDLVFEIKEGDATQVKKILFLGNKKFSSSVLKSMIRTKESRWFRFLTSEDSYDPDRIGVDREMLRQHYLEQGYVDFKVISSVAELTPDRKGFFITFVVDEGPRYKVGKVSIEGQLKSLDTSKFNGNLLLKKGDWFNGKRVDRTIDKLIDHVGSQGFAFANVEPSFDRNAATRTVDINFLINEGAHVYVGRIDVEGNVVTRDQVIRREFRLHEGDSFNTTKLERTRQRLENLDFFSRVDVQKEKGSAPDRVDLKVTTKEKSTGEISFAAGVTSVEGVIGTTKFLEKNFMGKGQEFSSEFTLSRRTRDFDISFTEPYFLDKPLSAGVDLFRTRSSQVGRGSQSGKNGFVHSRTGISPRIGYHLTEFLVQRWWYSLKQDKLSGIDSDASLLLKDQEGSRLTSMVGHELIYDKRDSRVNPTEGYVLQLTNEYAGLGGQAHFWRNNIEGKNYFPVADQVVLGVRGQAGTIQPINGHKLKIVDRYFLGGESLRGFEYYGVSPRDSAGEGVGGRNYWSGSVELSFPLGLPPEFGIKGAVFNDLGSAWKSGEKYAGVRDEKSMRAAVGVGISWASPMGPIRLDFSKAYKYQKFDQRQTFLFSFKTSF